MTDLPEATRRFLDAVADLDVTITPRVFPDGTKTSADAAAAVGCDLAQIAKSIVFMVDGEPLIVLMSGDRRVDPVKLAAASGATEARRATLEEAREHTGYAAGGTPAFGHRQPVRVLADVSLRRNDDVWSAAGTPTTVYPIALADLVALSAAEWADVAE
ncbi:MAG: YbaK/EbsC family protein [Actinobacteria bacterium]|nr:MAG: YbaK/EbsC family protein [Actinomycetota bacterium]